MAKKSKLASMKGLSETQLDPIAGGAGVGVNPQERKDEMEGAMQDMAFAAEEDIYAEAEAEGSVIGVAGVAATGLGIGAAAEEDAEEKTAVDAAAGLGVAPGLGLGAQQAAPASDAAPKADAASTVTAAPAQAPQVGSPSTGASGEVSHSVAEEPVADLAPEPVLEVEPETLALEDSSSKTQSTVEAVNEEVGEDLADDFTDSMSSLLREYGGRDFADAHSQELGKQLAGIASSAMTTALVQGMNGENGESLDAANSIDVVEAMSHLVADFMENDMAEKAFAKAADSAKQAVEALPQNATEAEKGQAFNEAMVAAYGVAAQAAASEGVERCVAQTLATAEDAQVENVCFDELNGMDFKDNERVLSPMVETASEAVRTQISNTMSTALDGILESALEGLEDSELAESLNGSILYTLETQTAALIEGIFVNELDDDASAAMLGRSNGQYEAAIAAYVTGAAIDTLTKSLKEDLTEAIKDLGDDPSQEDIARAVGKTIKDVVDDDVVDAAENMAEGVVDAFVGQLEARDEARSPMVEDAVELAQYVAFTPIKDNVVESLSNTLSSMSFDREDARYFVALMAGRAAGTATQVFENLVTDNLASANDGDLGDMGSVHAANQLMTGLMDNFNAELEKTFNEEMNTIFNKMPDKLDPEGILSYLSDSLNSSIETMAIKTANDSLNAKTVAATVEEAEGSQDKLEAQAFRSQFSAWSSESTTLADPKDSLKAYPGFSPPKFGALPEEKPESAKDWYVPPTHDVGTNILDNAEPYVEVPGDVDAKATSGVHNGTAYAAAGASVGTSLTQKAGSWTQTISVGAAASAHAYAGSDGVGAGAAFMAGVMLETDFGGGERVIQKAGVEGHAAAALGFSGLGVSGAAGADVKFFSMVRAESNTDLFAGADLDANAQAEAEIGAEADANASMGLDRMGSGFGAGAGAAYSAGVDGKLNTSIGSAGGGAKVISPGAVGVQGDINAGFSDGKFRFEASGEVSALLAGAGFNINLEVNVLDNTHTRGSAQEIQKALGDMVEHILDYDDDMTESIVKDLSADIATGKSDLEVIEAHLTAMSEGIANYIENEDAYKPLYQAWLTAEKPQIEALEKQVEEVRARVEAEPTEYDSRLWDPDDDSEKGELARLEAQLNFKQSNYDIYSDLIDGGDFVSFEGWKQYYELEKAYVEDLEADHHKLEVGSEVREAGEAVNAAKLDIKEWEDLSDDAQEKAKEQWEKSHEISQKAHGLRQAQGPNGYNYTYERQMEIHKLEGEYNEYMKKHPDVATYVDAVEATNNLPDLEANFNEIAPHSFVNQSTILVGAVDDADDHLHEMLDEQAQTKFDGLAYGSLLEFYAEDKGDIKEFLAQQKDELREYNLFLTQNGLTVDYDMAVNYDPGLVFADDFELVSLKEVMSDAEALKPPEIGDYVPEHKEWAGPETFVDKEVVALNHKIQNDPAAMYYFAMTERVAALEKMINSGDYPKSAEETIARVTETQASYETYHDKIDQAEEHLQNTVNTLKAEHPMLQSQHKLDTCNATIASLTKAIEGGDLSREELDDKKAELAGWEMFLDKNEENLKADVAEMKAHHEKHQKDLNELKGKHTHLSEMVTDKGILGWMF